VIPAAAAVPMPEGFSFDDACSFFGSYETAYHCLIARGRLQAGETVLIHGASGSTGLAAVHVAKRVGATVIATGRSPDKLAVVAAQGADHVVRVGDDQPRLRDQVKELTGGRGVDVVYDGVGGAISAESMRATVFGARYLIVGWAATPFVARGSVDPNQLPTNLIMMKGLDVLGCPMVISTQKDPSIRAARLTALLAWAAAGMRPHISHSYPIEQFRQALHDKWHGKVIGAAVLHPRAG
jgi:NADPH2:quinone reductase